MRQRIQFDRVESDTAMRTLIKENGASNRKSMSTNLAIVDIAPAPKTITRASLSFQGLLTLRRVGRGSPRMTRSLAIVNPFVAVAGVSASYNQGENVGRNQHRSIYNRRNS